MEYSFLENLVEKPISGEWGSAEGNVNVIRTANFTNNGKINFSKVVGRDIAEKKVENKKLQIEDIIIEKSGGSPTQPVGRVVFFEKNGLFLCNNFTSILRPLKQQVYPKYLHYILFCNHKFGFVKQYQNKTTGIINLQLAKYLKNTQIPLPPLPEQQKIAAILDAADQLRQNDQQLIEKYNELSQSLFLDMFGDPVVNPMGWDKVEFGSIGKLDRGKSKHRPRNAPELLGGIHPLIQTGDVANCGGYIRKYNSTYSDIGLAQSKIWEAGTLCITIAANIAKTGILTFDTCFPDSVVGFVPNDKSDKEFVRYWLSFLQKTLEDTAPMAAQKNINLKILRELDLPLPPITLQNQFAERIQAIESQKQQAQASLQKSEDLFNSLLQRAFKGELVI